MDIRGITDVWIISCEAALEKSNCQENRSMVLGQHFRHGLF